MLPTFRSLIFARQLMPKNFYRGYVIDVDERRCCINERFLTHTGIMYEKPNLGKTTFHYPPFPITGVYRDHSRFMVCMKAQLASRKRPGFYPIINIWFSINTSSRNTYLSKKTCEALFAPEKDLGIYPIFLQDPNYVLQCYHDPKFEEINVLGSDALEHLKISSMNVNWKHKKFVLSRDEDLEGSKL